MKKILLIILAAAAVIIVAGVFGFYAGINKGGEEPWVVFTSPAGGEEWQTGTTHTISWSTRGVPAGYKIAVTIRRIPPPPLQQEGQEFDPIIFTNLENTGRAEWTIPGMYPSGTYVLGINSYESVPVMNPVSAESGEFRIINEGLE